MYPAEVPIVPIYAGDHTRFPSYVITEAAVPLDLTSYTDWKAQWRSDPLSEVALELTVDTTDLANGRFTVIADSADTDAMGSSGWFDVQATNAFGAVRTFVFGRTSWRKDVTRD